MSKSQMNTMIITFFDNRGTVHYKCIPQGQIVNQAYYVEILNWLHETAYRKRHELWPNDLILHQGIAPAHKVLCQVVSGPKMITEIEHPPYS
jgi:hypothetical protein